MIWTFSLKPVRRHWRLWLVLIILMVAAPAWWREVEAGARGGTNPNLVWYVKTHQKVVALTFDDGPSEAFTPKILSILNQAHAKATFFMLGQAATAHPALVREVSRMGMEIGNHTYAHINLKVHSPAQDRLDLIRSQDAIQAITGKLPTLMRPPYGAYNAALIKVARSLNLRVILWSWTEDPRDWANPGVAAIVSRVVNHIQPGDIVLFHDGGGDRSQTVEALSLIVKDLSAQGYRMVTVSHLLNDAEPNSHSPQT